MLGPTESGGMAEWVCTAIRHPAVNLTISTVLWCSLERDRVEKVFRVMGYGVGFD